MGLRGGQHLEGKGVLILCKELNTYSRRHAQCVCDLDEWKVHAGPASEPWKYMARAKARADELAKEKSRQE